MYVLNDHDCRSEIFKKLRSFAASILQNSTPRTCHSLPSLHDFNIQLKYKLLLQADLVRQLFLKSQMVSVARSHQIRLPN